MKSIINAAFSRSRVVLMLFVMILAFGAASFTAIPKESSPEVPIPIVFVTTTLEGISPEDAATSLMQPLETELSSLEGLKSMKTSGFEGGGSITLEFDPGFNSEAAMEDVRRAVEKAKPSLPDAAADPVVQEINTALFPIMTLILSGPVPERALNSAAEQLADRIEAIAGVLEVDIAGQRDEVLEVIIDPLAIETYGLSLASVAAALSQNNALIAAGALDAGDGRVVMKIPGLLQSAQDVLDLPLKSDGAQTVALRDIAKVRQGFEDATGYARIDGSPAMALEVTKKSGANIIETAAKVRAVVDGAKDILPDGMTVSINQDESEQVTTLLGDLQNNVIASVILVVIVILAFLGPRSAFLVGLSIPGAFLAGIATLWVSGYTLNIVVLFALILVAGMLVDGAIVVVEHADRLTRSGTPAKDAFLDAAQRMTWPIISSTATTLSVFLPLLFWQGVIGEFMKFLPITVLITLTASIFMALIFIPVIGGVISKSTTATVTSKAIVDPRSNRGVMGSYARMLEHTIMRPRTTIFVVVATLAGVIGYYASHGNGVEFFPSTEPDFAQVQIISRDNLSLSGRNRLVLEAEQRVVGWPGISSVYARANGPSGSGSADQVGTLQLQFADWQTRKPAEDILEDIRADLSAIPGIEISMASQAGGPASGKPILVEVVGLNQEKRAAAVKDLRTFMEGLGGITDISDTLPLPGVDFQLRIDRASAAEHGADLSTIGRTVQLVTRGITASDYRPIGADESIDIRLRYPSDKRQLSSLEDLTISTTSGMVPLSTFATLEPVARSGSVLRVDQETLDTVEAGVEPGVLPAEKITKIATYIAETQIDGVEMRMKGEAADQAEAMTFLATAFVVAIGLMLVILVAQFNSISQALVVLSAIILSIAGVFIAVLLTGRPFNIVMGGIGIISLAGIVVNNNIVLIDAYNEHRAAGRPPLQSALLTGCERMRPVLLTSGTTILGLVPMALALSIDIVGRSMSVGAPSTLWWIDLSLSIVGGLTFATVMTLLVTPATLVLIDSKDRRVELGRAPHGPLRRIFNSAKRRASRRRQENGPASV